MRGGPRARNQPAAGRRRPRRPHVRRDDDRQHSRPCLGRLRRGRARPRRRLGRRETTALVCLATCCVRRRLPDPSGLPRRTAARPRCCAICGGWPTGTSRWIATMIPLGSCTMKLNATTEMEPITWPEFADLHPFAPLEQTDGIPGADRRAVDLAGRDHRLRRGLAAAERRVAGRAGRACWRSGPTTGPTVRRPPGLPDPGQRPRDERRERGHGRHAGGRGQTADDGTIDLDDLRAKVAAHAEELAAMMVTYPSTHGVFEETISELCALVHDAGGQVYVDGANLNALVGLAQPGRFGADVSHLNLHKTFCIPHGGGGPGVGPVGVRCAPRALPAEPPAGSPRRDRRPGSARSRAAPSGSAAHPADHAGPTSG